MSVAKESVQGAPRLTKEPYRLLQRLSFLKRNRFQLLGAFVLAVVLPAALEIGAWSEATPWAERNTALGTLVAILGSAYMLRRIASHPFVNRVSYTLPAVGASFVGVIVVFEAIGMSYSLPQLLESFIIGSAWFMIVGAVEQALSRPRLLILPGACPDKLGAIAAADWSVAASPNMDVAVYTGVVADLRHGLDPEWERFLARAALAGVPAYHSKDIAEALTGRVEIEHLVENNLPAVVPSRVYERAKRGLDFLGALLALPMLVPVYALVALAIKLDDGGKVFFRQERRGYRGSVFSVLKFRTMREGADKGEVFTAENDPRVTRVGRILRRWRIDELPQVWNVLKGEMSWIGPRPESLELSRWYEAEIPFYAYRHIVRPGITGWAAVHQGNVAEIDAATDKLAYDFYYIKHQSVWLDAIVFFKTLRTVLTGFGSR